MGVFIELKASPVAVNAMGRHVGRAEDRDGDIWTVTMADAMFEHVSNGQSLR